MLRPIAGEIRKIAFMMGDEYSGDAPYLNIPFYRQRTDPADPSEMIDQGPPSMYDEPDPKQDRLKNKEDIRRQGERPMPRDPFEKHILPVRSTVIGQPRENLQGGEWNDTTEPRGRGDFEEDRDTIGFNPGETNVNIYRVW